MSRPSRFTYVMEAIVRCGPPSLRRGSAVDPSEEMELLCRGGFDAGDEPAWERWYANISTPVLTAVQNGVKRVAINLDTVHILNPKIADSIERTVSGMPVDIEWTENVNPRCCREEDIKRAAARLVAWRDNFGFRISIDDVGAGHDGLGRVCLTNAHRVKIAGPLFHQWRTSEKHAMLLRKMVDLYRSGGAEVVVEWVETLEDVSRAEWMGATHTQGRIWQPHDIYGII